ncbi:MAG: hypothetical protein PHH35_00100 [Candidatus Pacebacteria bacterium]|jgi:hypothetical protein|nr:hypothetical protein [Candidatus Paceibacterota bacterium]
MLNSVPLVILIISLSIATLVITPLIASLILQLLSRLLKFPKTDFKTALYCNLIILGIFVACISTMDILFLDQIEKLSSLFLLVSSLIALITGSFVIHKFYNSSVLKSFFALLLTGVILFIAFTLVIIMTSVTIALIKH